MSVSVFGHEKAAFLFPRKGSSKRRLVGAYSVFSTLLAYPLPVKTLILLGFCRYRYHTLLLYRPGIGNEVQYERGSRRGGRGISGDVEVRPQRLYGQGLNQNNSTQAEAESPGFFNLTLAEFTAYITNFPWYRRLTYKQ
jgi:hypothetical protein